eukprot:s1496_g14.t1
MLAREVSGMCWGGAREVPGRCSGGAGEVLGRCRGGAGEVPGRCRGGAGQVMGRSWGGAGEVPGREVPGRSGWLTTPAVSEKRPEIANGSIQYLAAPCSYLFSETMRAMLRRCAVVAATTAATATAASDRAGSRMLLNLDLNGDGQVNPEEMDLFAQQHGLDRFTAKDFQALDGDKDGALNALELEQGLRSTVSSREVREVPSGPSMALTQTDADSSAMSVAETVVKSLDPSQPQLAACAAAAI